MFKKFKKDIEEVEKEVHKPISKKDIENVIKLINVAHETGCQFTLELTLSIGDFRIDSDAYSGMKLLNETKNEKDRVVISYQNALLSNDTLINIENISAVTLNIQYSDKNESSA